MIHGLVQPDSRLARIDCDYNLFRSKLYPELICAVPENRCVPAFITGEAWSFHSKVADRSSQPPGFDQEAAQIAVRFNGFYLFQLTGAERKPSVSLRVLSCPTRRAHAHAPQLPAAKRLVDTPALAQRSVCG